MVKFPKLFLTFFLIVITFSGISFAYDALFIVSQSAKASSSFYSSASNFDLAWDGRYEDVYPVAGALIRIIKPQVFGFLTYRHTLSAHGNTNQRGRIKFSEVKSGDKVEVSKSGFSTLTFLIPKDVPVDDNRIIAFVNISKLTR